MKPDRIARPLPVLRNLAWGLAFTLSAGVATGTEPGLGLILERVKHDGSHVHIRLINQGRQPIRVFLGGVPMGAAPFELIMDKDDTGVPIAAEHRHDFKPVIQTLEPGKHYLVEIGADQQFLGHGLVATYKVEAKDCSDCWAGKLVSAPLSLPAK